MTWPARVHMICENRKALIAMHKRIGKLTIATAGASAALYYNHTPYRTSGVRFVWQQWTFGYSRSWGVRAFAFAFGPLVFSFVDVTGVRLK